jgi:hypothetical protein
LTTEARSAPETLRRPARALARSPCGLGEGQARTALVPLPIEDNAALIYGDLGAYTGQRLGTPCDDF